MIIGRSEPHHEIDTQIGRLADEFRKKESPDGIRALEREGGRNSEGRGVMLPVGGEAGSSHSAS